MFRYVLNRYLWSLDIPKKISHVFRYLTWSQIPVKTSIWHTLRKKTKSLEPLAYERIAIVFQPTARASPAHTKTNRRSAHRLEALEIWFFFSMCAKWMSPSESDFMLNIQWHEEIFETSRLLIIIKLDGRQTDRRTELKEYEVAEQRVSAT